VLFLAPTTNGGARPTTSQESADEYSEDRKTWHPIPANLSPVTGRLDAHTTALVFDALQTANSAILDIWQYSDLTDPREPERTMLGRSTVCAFRCDMSHHLSRMKSRYRRIIAVPRLAPPFCVRVR